MRRLTQEREPLTEVKTAAAFLSVEKWCHKVTNVPLEQIVLISKRKLPKRAHQNYKGISFRFPLYAFAGKSLSVGIERSLLNRYSRNDIRRCLMGIGSPDDIICLNSRNGERNSERRGHCLIAGSKRLPQFPLSLCKTHALNECFTSRKSGCVYLHFT